MRRLILSCKKATYLISLREEGKLPPYQQVQLRIHLAVCSMCKLFAKQTAFITRRLLDAKPPTQATNLSEPARKKLEAFVKEIISGKK